MYIATVFYLQHKVSIPSDDLGNNFTTDEQNLAQDTYYLMVRGRQKEKIAVIKRGEVYYADLNPVVGSEQGGVRPVVILQNDVGNKFSPTIIAAATTSKLDKAKLPTHIQLPKGSTALPKNSLVLLEQIRTIDKSRIKEKIGELPASVMSQIEQALLISLGF